MSSYLNIYGRVKSDLYKIERIKDTEYHKQGDVILFDSYSRNCILYQIISECVSPAWAGDEELYTILTKEKIEDCIIKCKEEIKWLKESINKSRLRRKKYIKYLQNLPKVLSYKEFANFTVDDEYAEETKETIKDYKHCLSHLELIKEFIYSCDLQVTGFSEVLCNIN